MRDLLKEFRRRQLGVALGMAAGLALTIAAFLLPPMPFAAADRMALAVACSTIAVSWLVLAVSLLARHRFFSAVDIDGAGLTQPSPQAKLLQALVQNTLEQTVLAVTAYVAWAIQGRPAATIAACVLLFSFGRLLFFIFYSRGAGARAFGFALTFYPTVGLIALMLPRAIAGVVAALRF